MKINLQNILILFSLTFLGFVNAAIAQESSMPEMEVMDTEKERERVLYSPGEADTRYIPKNQTQQVKETTQTSQPSNQSLKYKHEKPAPTPKSTVEKQSKNEEDSILSFNFLYYIIQKYKLQDIID
jgi:hypothetical protein